MEEANESKPASGNFFKQLNTPIKTRHFFALLLGAVLVCALFITGFYMGAVKSTKKLPYISIQPQAPNPVVSKKPPQAFIAPDYQKRFYETTKNFFEDIKYPTEITSTPEQNLVGVRCMEFHCAFREEVCFYDSNKITKRILGVTPSPVPVATYEFNEILPQDDYISVPVPPIVQKLRDDLGMKVVELSPGRYNYEDLSLSLNLCDTQDANKIVMYGGGETSGSKIAIVDGNDNIKYSSDLNTDLPYPVCTPLQISQTGIAYIKCQGGDGPFGGAILYKLNLRTGSLEEINRCTTEDRADGTPSTTVCK